MANFGQQNRPLAVTGREGASAAVESHDGGVPSGFPRVAPTRRRESRHSGLARSRARREHRPLEETRAAPEMQPSRDRPLFSATLQAKPGPGKAESNGLARRPLSDPKRTSLGPPACSLPPITPHRNLKNDGESGPDRPLQPKLAYCHLSRAIVHWLPPRGMGIRNESGFECCRHDPRGSVRGGRGACRRARLAVPVGSLAGVGASGFDPGVLAAASEGAPTNARDRASPASAWTACSETRGRRNRPLPGDAPG